MRSHLRWPLYLVFGLLISLGDGSRGCVNATPLPPSPSLSSSLWPDTLIQRGRASWYGPGFHGRRAANGSRYNMFALTAAHRTLPLGMIVRVTNLANGRQLTVTITDRGPYVRGRILDLSYAAAHRLDVLHRGTTVVRVDAVRPFPFPSGLRTGGGQGLAGPLSTHVFVLTTLITPGFPVRSGSASRYTTLRLPSVPYDLDRPRRDRRIMPSGLRGDQDPTVKA